MIDSNMLCFNSNQVRIQKHPLNPNLHSLPYQLKQKPLVGRLKTGGRKLALVRKFFMKQWLILSINGMFSLKNLTFHWGFPHSWWLGLEPRKRWVGAYWYCTQVWRLLGNAVGFKENVTTSRHHDDDEWISLEYFTVRLNGGNWSTTWVLAFLPFILRVQIAFFTEMK